MLTESRGHKGPVVWIQFSPDGASVVTASQDATAHVWSFAPDEKTPGALLSGAELRGHTGWVRTAVYSPDSKSIVTASADGTARVWDLGDTAERIQKMSVPDLIDLARKRVTRELTPEERSKFASDQPG